MYCWKIHRCIRKVHVNFILTLTLSIVSFSLLGMLQLSQLSFLDLVDILGHEKPSSNWVSRDFWYCYSSSKPIFLIGLFWVFTEQCRILSNHTLKHQPMERSGNCCLKNSIGPVMRAMYCLQHCVLTYFHFNKMSIYI